ncbi:MAG TPA: alpha-amylase/4-alpha-glucanotransferase domain-containing protein [Pirellulales bacterium]|jgi:alpha-amylase
MNDRLRLVLALHQHQPVGNLDQVTEGVYRDCYLPLVETLADYPTLPVNLHTSGSLLDWLAGRHPEYTHRLRELAAAGRIEIMGGAYHDPLLPMLSQADRRGQINSFSRRLGQLFGQVPRGMWMPERIWDPALAADLAACDIEHTVLDDFHFHAAGLADDQLRGYYLTESEGGLIALFAGEERLRYLIPFAEPEETIAYLRDEARRHPGGVLVYADDAEKFGAWPGMRERMQNSRWLRRFLDALAANSDWLQVTTLGECIDHVPPLGKVYVPEGSYREMGPWSTLAKNVQHSPAESTSISPDTSDISAIPLAGTWRNFRVRYPEIDEMYCRMLQVSKRAQAAVAEDADDSHPLIEQARQALYRAQCGCAYWHGIFGGVYSPHLRQAVYRNLLAAESLLDIVAGRTEPWLSATIDDFNLDVHKELSLTSGKLGLFLAPDRGGQLYELDVRDVGANLLASLTRRPEPYHRQTATLASAAENAHLIYDSYARKSLLDHFFDVRCTLDQVAACAATEQGDFLAGRYRARLRRIQGGVCAQLARTGRAFGQPVTVTKQLTLWADRSVVDIHYELTGLPPGRPCRFAVEFNFAGLPPACPDRYFVDSQGRVLADLGHRLDLSGVGSLRLVDRWLGVDIGLSASEVGGIWAFPIQSVSRSQRGLETIQQSVAVFPHWIVVGDAAGRWSVDLQLAIVTSPAATRTTPGEAIAAAPPAKKEPGVARESSVRQSTQYVVDGPHAQPAPKSIIATPQRRVYEG